MQADPEKRRKLVWEIERRLIEVLYGERRASMEDAIAYEETVRKGGAVLSVDAGSEEQQVAVDRALQDTGFQRRTDWG